MAIRKIDDVWYADIRYHKKRYRWRSPQNTAPGARAYENYLRGEIAARGSLDHLDPKKQPKVKRQQNFAEYADDWLKTYVRNQNRSSERQSKESILRLHLKPYFGRSSLSAINRREIDGYKAKKLEEGFSAKSINNHLTVLRKCLWTAQTDDLLSSLPLIQWLKEDIPDFDFLLVEESHRLLQDRSEPFWVDLARFAVRTGLRRGELMALDWSRIDLARKQVEVRASIVRGVHELPKTHRVRHVPLTDDVVAMLAPRVQGHGLVFPGVDGRPLSQTAMLHGIRRLCRRTGLRQIGWHALRHTFASQLVMEGVPLLTVSRLMGHTTVKMTERYAHLAPSHLAEAVPVLLRAEGRVLEARGHAGGQEGDAVPQSPLERMSAQV
ncbi:MAG: site-specific integrase [Myxococcaceae bacterium]|nr:MAG: site-specific integrase [Myxococcaceae bacterium]